MAISSQYSLQNSSNRGLGEPSIYDALEQAEPDLWFLPQDYHEQDDPGVAQPPRAEQRLLFDPADWSRAQDSLSSALASLSFRFGALDARLASMDHGIRRRLAIREAAEMSWGTGARIEPERLALWLGQRAGGGLDGSLALAQAGWAVRRLVAGQGPDVGGWIAGMATFLGYAQGQASAAIEELDEVMIAARHLHPVTQSAMLFYAWHVAGRGPARGMEAAVMAACHGASMAGRHGGGPGAAFLPLGMAGGVRRISGSAFARLAAWIDGAEQATLAAIRQVDSVALWQAAAGRALSDMTGRTPAMLIDLLAAWPMVSAPIAEAQTGASRAAIQRNLDLMNVRGLIREISGQGRYRVWAAKI